jgi:hypothetical protein
LELDHLNPIDEVSRVLNQVHEQRLPLACVSASAQSVAPAMSIPARSSSGTVSSASVDALRECNELLFFVHADGTRLWELQPKIGKLEVSPQDWFNAGDFDRGYQWCTRAARDGVSGAIVGEGLRIGTFVLDGTGRKISKWLEKTA